MSNTNSSKSNSIESNLLPALKGTPHIPEEAYPHIPEPIKSQLGRYSLQTEKDVFITGGLAVLSGCLVNVQAVYGPEHRVYGPNLFLFVISPAGGGKAPLADAENEIAYPVHKYRMDKSKRERAAWEQQMDAYESADDDENVAHPGLRPAQRGLLIPGNTSAIALTNSLRDNDGHGVIVESEADTISNILDQDWGNFSDVLRKAHAHERVSINRKDDQGEIRRPRLSVALSGTPAQVPRLISSIEDGLFSRFMFYGFVPAMHWKDMTPDYDAIDSGAGFEASAQSTPDVLKLYKVLSGRDSPLQVRLTPAQWTKLNNHGQEMKRRLFNAFNYSGTATAHRMGLHILRLTCVIAVWKHWDEGTDLDSEKWIEAPDTSFEAALALAITYFKHAKLLMDALPKSSFGADLPKLEKQWYDALPDRFRTQEAIDRATDFSIAERTAKRRLSEWADGELLHKLKQGHYQKPDTSN